MKYGSLADMSVSVVRKSCGQSRQALKKRLILMAADGSRYPSNVWVLETNRTIERNERVRCQGCNARSGETFSGL